MSHSSLKEIIHTILDKRLYGFSFFLLSVPYLAMGLLIMALVYYMLNPVMFLFYAPLFIILILISGLGSKNYVPRREMPNIGRFRGLLLLLASYFAVMTPFYMNFSDDLIGSFNFLLIFGISTLALTVAVIEITIFGQRVALRDKMQLTKDFCDKQVKVWKKDLEGFPNVDKIVSELEDGKFAASLFDRGSFNLTILWSCNTMEKIVDIITEKIISKDPTKRELYRKEDDTRLGYPSQLQNLGFKPNIGKNRKDEQIKLEVLWHEIRNKIAHENYKPTFQETAGAIHVFVSFIKEMPEILQIWKDQTISHGD